MCGVAASLGPGATDRVEQMVQSMSYRGIRSRIEGSYDWSVGHVRLPIVGVGRENDQPVVERGWTVGFVGEILDFRDKNPTAGCDLDTVVRTWTERGPRGFTLFDGFWSVVAYSQQRQELHLLVDYLCQKPLYVRADGIIAVASEPDAVARISPVTLDEVYLSAVAKWGYCPETWRTPYREVWRVLPGEMVILDQDGVRSRVRVDPLVPVSLGPLEIRHEIENAVRRRVGASDVPVACLVSGGLDSSIVWALAGRYGEPRAYHAENGELSEARMVAPGVEGLSLVGVDDRTSLDYMQEPIDLGSLVPQVALSDAIARQGAERVCLTGDGADELFGGYRRSARYDSQASDVWHELVAWHLPRLDRVMMRNRVEVRSPFLARRVAGAALALPYEDRINKCALRDIFRGDLLPGVADRPKWALRTNDVEEDRESRSIELVRLLRERSKPWLKT